MSAFSDALSVTGSGLKAQATRLRVVSENIANVDTPGYRRKTLPFELKRGDTALARVEPGRVRLDRSDLARIHDPAHPLADASGHYALPTFESKLSHTGIISQADRQAATADAAAA